MKKILFIALALCATVILIESCKKDDKEDTKPASCSDGVQNHGETGVDCGGPCFACVSTLCNGNGGTSFYPLALNNSWHYNDPGEAEFTNTISSTATFGTTVYYKIDNSQGGSLYLRQAANGDLMAYNTTLASEYLYLPNNPIVNQTWVYPLQGAATRKVLNTNVNVSTPSCNYSNCVQIQHYDAGGNPGAVMYYRRAVGMVTTDELNPGVFNTDLDAVTLH
jgi:hypothetical protein